MQIDHVAIPVADIAAARAFYEQALAPLGVQVVAERPSAVVFGGGQGQGMVGLRQGSEYRGPVHVAFSTDDRAGVDAFYEAGSQPAALTTAPRACEITSRTTTPPTSAIRTGTTSKQSAARHSSAAFTPR